VLDLIYIQRKNSRCVSGSGCRFLRDFGCDVPTREVHPVNWFLKEWFGSGRGELGAEDGLAQRMRVRDAGARWVTHRGPEK
jgi:hypothetical protein